MAFPIKKAAAILLAASMILASGCGGTPAPAKTTEPPERPTVTAAPGKIAPPDVSNFAGYSLNLKPARGPSVVMQEPVAAQLIMEAFSSERLQVRDAKAKFGNKVELVDPEGKVRYKFTLASDGQLLLKYMEGDGRVFRMPEYIYYLMENTLWSHGGSLMENQVKWQPDKGTQLLELELPRLVKSAMLPAFGYSMAYFTTYKIYGVNTETRNTAKVYLLVTYAGYGISGETFAPDFLYTTPVTMIFAKTGGDYWNLVEFKQPPQTKTKLKKDLYANVRTIFPYECMEPVMDDLADLSGQEKAIVRLATEYLNDVGISGLTVES
jgi:hypothetical protein